MAVTKGVGARWFAAAAVGWLLLCAAAGAQTTVAVYDADADGGESYGEKGIMQALARAGMRAELVTDLSERSLSGYRVLVLADVHRLGRESVGPEQSVRRFVRQGGGVLLTHDCRAAPAWKLFPELVRSGERHVSRSFGDAGLAVHPVNLTVVPFQSAFGDHWHLQPSSGATVVARCHGGAVAVAGSLGRGRVLAVGLAIGLDGTAAEAAPTGDEAQWLANAVRWLAGERDWMQAEVERSGLRVLLPTRVDQNQEPVRATVRVFRLPGAAPRKLSATVTMRADGAHVSGGRARRTSQLEKRRADLSELLRQVQQGRAYSVWEARCALPAKGLPDGKWHLHATVHDGQGTVVANATAMVRLVGQSRQREPDRMQRMKKIHSGSVIKFAFNQGFPAFPRDPSTYRPFIQALKRRNITAYDYLPELGRDPYIWEAEDFAALERLCAVADREGLKLWATLIPPSSSETIRKMGNAAMRRYYLATARRLAEVAKRHANFVGYTCDDFSHNHGFFTPEFVMEMSQVTRPIAPDLAFMPLCYWWGLSERFFKDYGLGIDGVVFHFRCDSHPSQYIPGYDPTSFEHHAQCMRHELKTVRKWAGDKVLVCGVYIGYTAYTPRRPAWGVPWIEGKGLSEDEHRAKDATMKLQVAHELADGIRIYGLGINDIAYQRMGELIAGWRQAGRPWGRSK